MESPVDVATCNGQYCFRNYISIFRSFSWSDLTNLRYTDSITAEYHHFNACVTIFLHYKQIDFKF